LKFFLNDASGIFLILFVILISGIEGFSLVAYGDNYSIPDWIKNNAKWWAEGKISDFEYTQAIQWLINEGIIKIK